MNSNPIFVMTNDPDHGTVTRYRKVFDALNSIPLRVTTAVFCTIEDDGSDLARHCRPGETHALDDPAYRDLMLEQVEIGHEIAFHGYSQISNTREQFIEGLDIFRGIFGRDPFTYIEHGGNPNRNPLGMCKRETLYMSGMDPNSRHFIMDVLRERVGCVWAFEALDETLDAWPTVDKVFFRLDDVLFFRRQRMSRLAAVAPPSADDAGCFVGYTHFGYDGHVASPTNLGDNWSDGWRDFSERMLSGMMERVQPENITLETLTRRFASQGVRT